MIRNTGFCSSLTGQKSLIQTFTNYRGFFPLRNSSWSFSIKLTVHDWFMLPYSPKKIDQTLENIMLVTKIHWLISTTWGNWTKLSSFALFVECVFLLNPPSDVSVPPCKARMVSKASQVKREECEMQNNRKLPPPSRSKQPPLPIFRITYQSPK